MINAGDNSDGLNSTTHPQSVHDHQAAELIDVKEEKVIVPEILTITHDHRNPFKG